MTDETTGTSVKLSSSDLLTAVVLFVITVISRIPFHSDRSYLIDSFGFCSGALGYLVAPHPPGYIGYCVLGRLVYTITHDINFSFVCIDIFSISLATAILYLLGKDMFGRTQGLIAAILFTASVDTLYCSEVALSYSVEALMVTLYALCVWKATRLKSRPWLLWGTAVLGIGTSVRSTGLMFLLPLWGYMVLLSTASNRLRLSSLVLLASLVLSWSIPLAHQMAKYDPKGYANLIYVHQGASVLGYDRASLPGEGQRFAPEKRFVWPVVELLVASFNKVAPPGPGAAPEVANASLDHALTLLRTQTLKLGFFTIVACGLSTCFWMLPLFSARVRTDFQQYTVFFALWILPAALFFALGHFGPWGFLLIYLPALVLMSAAFLVSFAQGLPLSGSQRKLFCYGLTACSALLSLGIFVFGRPLPETSEKAEMINLLLLQYTGPAIQQHFARARNSAAYQDKP